MEEDKLWQSRSIKQFQAFHSEFRCKKPLVRNFRCNILQKIIGISLYNDLFILSYYNKFSYYIKVSMATENFKLFQLLLLMQ